MNTILNNSALRQRMDIVELLALLGISFEKATEKQLLNAKLFIQNLQLTELDFGKIKLILLNIVEKVPIYTNLDLDHLMKISLPKTELDPCFSNIGEKEIP